MKAPPNTMKFPDDEDVYPEDVTHIDFLVNRVHVPKIETYYHCRIVKFPQLESKHHIIAVRQTYLIKLLYKTPHDYLTLV